MQFEIASANSGKADITLEGLICAMPKERTPGVSIIQPNSSESKVEDNGRAIAPDVVWRPLPVTSFTAPVT